MHLLRKPDLHFLGDQGLHPVGFLDLIKLVECLLGRFVQVTSDWRQVIYLSAFNRLHLFVAWHY